LALKIGLNVLIFGNIKPANYFPSFSAKAGDPEIQVTNKKTNPPSAVGGLESIFPVILCECRESRNTNNNKKAHPVL
jgi:hypothetical protein